MTAPRQDETRDGLDDALARLRAAVARLEARPPAPAARPDDDAIRETARLLGDVVTQIDELLGDDGEQSS